MAKQARSSVTRERIFDAFWREISRLGYQRLTVERVIRRAGVSKGSFYHHFRNKHDLFQVAYRAHTDKTRRNVERLVFTEGISIEDAIIGDVMRVIREVPDLRLIVTFLELDVMAMRDPALRKYRGEDYATKRAVTERALAEGIRRGELRPDIDVVESARFIYTGIFGVYLMHYSTGEADDVAAKVERYLRAFFRGLKVEPVQRARRSAG